MLGINVGRWMTTGLAVVAGGSLTVTPALAAAVPTPHVQTSPLVRSLLPSVGKPYQHGGWGRRDRGIDGGDLIAGLLIFGGIAAIASAVSKSQDAPVRQQSDDPYRYRNHPEDAPMPPPTRVGRALDDAVDACIAEASRGGDVEDIDDVQRTAEGWRVSGMLHVGSSFECSVANGRVVNFRSAAHDADGEAPGDDNSGSVAKRRI